MITFRPSHTYCLPKTVGEPVSQIVSSRSCITLPVVAWVFGTDYPAVTGEKTFPTAAGLVYAHTIGGEMVLAPVNDYFMCYLSPEDDENDAY